VFLVLPFRRLIITECYKKNGKDPVSPEQMKACLIEELWWNWRYSADHDAIDGHWLLFRSSIEGAYWAADSVKGLLIWAAGPESTSMAEALGGEAGCTSTSGYAALNLARRPSSTNLTPFNWLPSDIHLINRQVISNMKRNKTHIPRRSLSESSRSAAVWKTCFLWCIWRESNCRSFDFWEDEGRAQVFFFSSILICEQLLIFLIWS